MYAQRSRGSTAYCPFGRNRYPWMVTRTYLLRKFGDCDNRQPHGLRVVPSDAVPSELIAKAGIPVFRRTGCTERILEGLTTSDHAAHGEAEDEQRNETVDQERLIAGFALVATTTRTAARGLP